MLRWPLTRLHALRDERLRALIATAKRHSPWHADRLRSIDPDAFDPRRLADIPPMTKADLMANWDRIVTDPRLTFESAAGHLRHMAEHGPAHLLDGFNVVASSGSSGQRGVVCWDRPGWLTSGLVWWRLLAGTSPALAAGEGRMAVLAIGTPAQVSSQVLRTFGPLVGSCRFFPVTLPKDELIARLNAYQPTELFGYSHVLADLATWTGSGLAVAPRHVISLSEPLTAADRATIETAFGVGVCDLYGTSETGLLAMSRPGQAELHLVEDVAVYEPVDRHGSPAPEGTTAASLLVTNVVNHVMPLIRYQICDEVTLLPTRRDAPRHDDAWSGRRLAPVQGRSVPPFRYPGGAVVDCAVFSVPLTTAPHIDAYQVRQTAQGADIRLRLRGDGGLESLEPLRHQVISRMRSPELPDPQVVITVVEQLDRLPSGKLPCFISL